MDGRNANTSDDEQYQLGNANVGRVSNGAELDDYSARRGPSVKLFAAESER